MNFQCRPAADIFFLSAMCINQGKYNIDEVNCFVVWCYILEVSIAKSVDPDQTVPNGTVWI